MSNSSNTNHLTITTSLTLATAFNSPCLWAASSKIVIPSTESLLGGAVAMVTSWCLLTTLASSRQRTAGPAIWAASASLVINSTFMGFLLQMLYVDESYRESIFDEDCSFRHSWHP